MNTPQTADNSSDWLKTRVRVSLIFATRCVRNERDGSDSEDLRQSQHDEREVARRADTCHCLRAQVRNEVEVD